MREAYVRVSFGFVVVLVLLHVAGALLMPSDYLWGLDILGYCRWWHVAVFAAIAIGTLSLRQPKVMTVAEGALSRLGKKLSALAPRLSPLKLHLVLFVVSLGVLLLLRTKYSGGDSSWMHETMPLWLKRAYLSSAVLFALGWVGMACGLSYVAALQVAVTVVGALSVCALFALFARALGDRGRAALFLAAALASYGVSRLLPGYIEVYAVYVLFLAVYGWALARYCLDGKGLLLVLGALALALFAHIQAVILLPGTLLATILVARARRRLGRAAVAWVVFVAAMVLTYPSLLPGLAQLLPPGPAKSEFWSVRGQQTLFTPLATLLRARHWADVADVHLLVSAVGLGLLAAGLVAWWPQRERDRLTLVAAVHYALFVLGTILFHNFHHPIERDWDMFGPGALLLLVLAAALWRRLPEDKLQRTLLIILPLAACITLLWLAQQAGITGMLPPPDIRVGFALPD